MSLQNNIYSLVVPATNADFNKHVYYQVYASTNSTLIINGTFVTLKAGRTLNIVVNNIAVATGTVYLLGEKLDVPNDTSIIGGSYTITGTTASSEMLETPPIDGYAFWFRADGLSTGTTNNYGIVDSSGSVAQLTDLGSGTIIATQLIGNKQPILVESMIGTRSRKAIRFSGANSTDMIINNLSGLTNNISAITMYTVAKANGSGTTQIVFYFSIGGGSTGSRADIRSSTLNIWQTGGRRLDADSPSVVSGNSSTSAFKIIGSPIDYANSNGYIYENNTLINTNTSFGTDGNTSATNSTQILIGSTGSNYLTGDIGDILVYIGYHDATKVALIHNWLNRFYGLY